MSSQLKWLLIILTSIGILILNFSVIDPLVMEDPCQYHAKKMNFILRIFYTINNGSGGHPEMSIFNFIFTFIVGGFIGNFAVKIIDKYFPGLS